jgi:hypothetical protein
MLYGKRIMTHPSLGVPSDVPSKLADETADPNKLEPNRAPSFGDGSEQGRTPPNKAGGAVIRPQYIGLYSSYTLARDFCPLSLFSACLGDLSSVPVRWNIHVRD